MTISPWLQFYSNNNDVLIWDYKDNKYNKSNNVIINQTVPREMSKYFRSKSVHHVI